MAKKAELLEQAQKMGLEVTQKNTIAQIESAIVEAENTQKQEDSAPSEETVNEPADKKSDSDFAKSGKRSKKAVAEAEEKATKEARKAVSEEAEKPKKKPAPKTRPKHERRGKRYQQAYGNIDRSKLYSIDEAIKLAVDISMTKFDASIELHARLNVDPRQADQNIRDSIVLPAGTGKTIKVAVFAEADDVKTALANGADIAGDEEFLQQLDREEINFDVLIASPNVMSRLSKYARLLGPKGLMPSPKSGTVTNEISKAVSEAKSGKIDYRVDPSGIVHLAFGKVSFGPDKLIANAEKVIESIKSNKPASIKSDYIKSVYITTSMGPSVKVSV